MEGERGIERGIPGICWPAGRAGPVSDLVSKCKIGNQLKKILVVDFRALHTCASHPSVVCTDTCTKTSSSNLKRPRHGAISCEPGTPEGQARYHFPGARHTRGPSMVSFPVSPAHLRLKRIAAHLMLDCLQSETLFQNKNKKNSLKSPKPEEV